MKNISVAIKLALKNLAGNKARTFFSLLGVIIGVMLVIVVLSLGAGMKEYITNQLESFGTDIIEVEIKTPGKSAVSAGNMGGIATGISITTFKLHEAERIAGLEGIGPWYAGLMHQDVISYKEENQSAMIMGVTARVKEVDQKFGIAAGEMFTDEDDKNLKNFIIMGSKIAKDFFGSEKEAVGKRVKMGNQRFMVKGVLQERGGAGFFDFDELIYMPAQTLQKKVLGADHIQFAMFKYKDEEQEDLLVENINAILKEEHNINSPDEQDFAVISMSEAADIIDDVFRVLNFLLIGLTSISLIVGGVGIMNVMYVAVTERTFEIGLRKSLGAKEGIS